MVSWAGLLKTVHQPESAMSVGSRNDEASSPTVGVTQSSATRMRKTRITPPVAPLASLEASDRSGGPAASAVFGGAFRGTEGAVTVGAPFAVGGC